MGKLDRLISGNDFAEPSDGTVSFAEGVVKAVSSSGVSFTVPTFDDSTYLWGPCPYPTWSTGGNGPQVGDRCLILFPTGTAIDPWVIGWWPS